ncbi:MAG TPA: bacteriohemerythrin [Mariprofundaceae bacterium]|nr:bacteriohemerythrin [Mariprofundaceae bacterium]
MSIVWSEEYSTGEPEIDKQHKQLFKYLADLEEHIASGVTDEYMKQFLDYLGLYTRSHFCYEEICMRQRKCPVAKQNQEQHDKLLQAYTHYRERFEIEGVSSDLLNKLHSFLLSWLTNHILKIDTNLKACM